MQVPAGCSRNPLINLLLSGFPTNCHPMFIRAFDQSPCEGVTAEFANSAWLAGAQQGMREWAFVTQRCFRHARS